MATVEEGSDTVLAVWERNATGTDDWEELTLPLTGLQSGSVNDAAPEYFQRMKVQSAVLDWIHCASL